MIKKPTPAMAEGTFHAAVAWYAAADQAQVDRYAHKPTSGQGQRGLFDEAQHPRDEGGKFTDAVKEKGTDKAELGKQAVKRGGDARTFDIKGPSGTSLHSYEWLHEKFEDVDDQGNEKILRLSSWDQAETNPETGRKIVHLFTISDKSGKGSTVSLETAIEAMGYTPTSEGAKKIRGLGNAIIELATAERELKGLEGYKKRSKEDQIAKLKQRVDSHVQAAKSGKTPGEAGAELISRIDDVLKRAHTDEHGRERLNNARYTLLDNIQPSDRKEARQLASKIYRATKRDILGFKGSKAYSGDVGARKAGNFWKKSSDTAEAVDRLEELLNKDTDDGDDRYHATNTDNRNKPLSFADAIDYYAGIKPSPGQLSFAWDEAAHPRKEKGKTGGGQFRKASETKGSTIKGTKMIKQPQSKDYEARVTALENEGMTRSDAQGIVDMEDMQENPTVDPDDWKNPKMPGERGSYKRSYPGGLAEVDSGPAPTPEKIGDTIFVLSSGLKNARYTLRGAYMEDQGEYEPKRKNNHIATLSPNFDKAVAEARKIVGEGRTLYAKEFGLNDKREAYDGDAFKSGKHEGKLISTVADEDPRYFQILWLNGKLNTEHKTMGTFSQKVIDAGYGPMPEVQKVINAKAADIALAVADVVDNLPTVGDVQKGIGYVQVPEPPKDNPDYLTKKGKLSKTVENRWYKGESWAAQRFDEIFEDSGHVGSNGGQDFVMREAERWQGIADRKGADSDAFWGAVKKYAQIVYDRANEKFAGKDTAAGRVLAAKKARQESESAAWDAIRERFPDNIDQNAAVDLAQWYAPQSGNK